MGNNTDNRDQTVTDDTDLSRLDVGSTTRLIIAQDISQYSKRRMEIPYTNIKSKTTKGQTIQTVTTFDIFFTDYLLS